ncbi:MAG: nitrite reductase large subunit NirB [Nitrospirota bacterium]
MKLMKESLVVIGNGMAGIAVVEEILKRDADRYSVTVFGAEPRPNYNRILLSDVLAGKASADKIVLNSPAWYEANGIVLHAGDPAVKIDRTGKRVVSAAGRSVAYDRLLVAAGSVPFIPPIPGADREGVFAYRTLDDVEKIKARAEKSARAVVIGGGLLGLEAARALAQIGLEVKVAHLVGHLMEMQCDEAAGEIVRRAFERMGIGVLLRHAAEEIIGGKNGSVEGVRFSNGDAYEADLVVISTGIRPNAALARDAGLAVNRGIVVNDYMETIDPDILAVGECVEHRGKMYGLVAPLMEQARTAAVVLSGDRSLPYKGSQTSAKLKVAGIDVVSMGNFMSDGAGCEEIVFSDPGAGLYQKVVVQGGRVVGAILVGDIRPAEKLKALLRSGEDVTLSRAALLRGDSAPIAVADLPDDALVCGCMGVAKGTIVDAIEAGCASREAVAEKTRACTSCKSCGPTIDQLLQNVLGGEYVKADAAAKPFCACVPLSKPVLRAEIMLRGLKSVTEVLGALGNGVGCPACRPGLAYLVSEVWRNRHVEERKHRFINDRVHGTIDKNGAFSVVPRMYAGLTTPAELRRIAEVAEKYEVSLVKLTGGARIDLFGVDKADLPRIWADLGMPSGHAYTKAIRTCKACVGTDFCKFGVADSLGAAVAMEKAFEGLYTPHKVKMAVSGCPRNCVEATVKDIGLVGIQGAWEIYVGGAAGMSVRKGDLLATVATREEAIEISARYLQFYREEANYAERTYGFNDRVGIEKIKEAVFDSVSGPALCARYKETKALVTDPWLERDAPVHPRQFEALEPVMAGGVEDDGRREDAR